MDDFYAANSEWYPALVAAWQSDADAAVDSLLGPVDGDVVDIASGIGSCLPLLRRKGATRLFAVEPSSSMRVGLMTTVAADSDLLRHTTIVASPFPEALSHLPDRWSGAVMLNAIGHLGEEERAMLWTSAGERLTPGGRLVITLQPPASVTAIPWTDFATVEIGEHRLITRGRAEPLDDTHVEWNMEWTLTDDAGAIVDRRTASHRWRVLNRSQIFAEAGEHGLKPVTDENDFFFAVEQS